MCRTHTTFWPVQALDITAGPNHGEGGRKIVLNHGTGVWARDRVRGQGQSASLSDVGW